MFNIYYLIRILKEIFGRRKLQKIIILTGLICVLVLVFTKLGAFAYEMQGNDTYTDPNSSIFMMYDSYINDLSVRLMSSSSSDARDLVDRLTSSKSYSFIILYGHGNTDTENSYDRMRVVLFPADMSYNASAYDQWKGMNCDVVFNSGSASLVYDFTNMNCVKSTPNSNEKFYFPDILLNRYNTSLIQVLSNLSNTDTNDIVGAINNQTAAVNNQTSAINTQTNTIAEGNDILQDTQDFVTDDSTDTNEMSVDTSQASIQDNTGIDNFFTTFLQGIQTRLENYDESEVTYLRIPFNIDGRYIEIPSNLLYKAIPPTFLRTLITTFWYYLFGGYIIMYAYRMIIWLESGEVFGEGGVSHFIDYLSKNNEVIKGYMM